ncbi:MAG: sensor histidine kinase, partial [Xanthomonas perforans]|nr:sensor histidine kinase [Xanthomonas perforans]
MNSSDASFLRTLCSLRWLATAGQAATILVATGLMGLDLPQQPLWAGVAALAVFNLYAQLRVAHRGAVSPATEFGHILVDVTVLTWMVGWSGGIANPFGSLFLVLIALAALALPLGWAMAVAASCVAGYVISAAFGLPLPYGSFDPLSLHMWGMAANFLLSTVVVLAFATRLALSMREREREISTLRERFARNEGIVALA